jgi:phosphate transport system protein
MPRDTLDRQIHHLQDEILLLGSMVEQAMLNSVDALKNRDHSAAHQIYEDDYLINEKRFAIENAILILIATQQPIARDLRMLAAMLEVITELERMGDYAKGIAKVTIKLEDSTISIPHRDIGQMAEIAVGMLHRALSAFITENQNLASAIPLEDDEVDELYNKIYHGLVSSMIANPETIDQSNLIMWVAHNLERMADRVTNICERTVFIATGELLEFDTTDDEDLE